MPWQQVEGLRPIEELILTFDPTQVEQRMRRRRRAMWSRVVSLVITLALFTGLYFWQRDELQGSGFFVVAGVVLGLSVALLVLTLVGYLRARRELAGVGNGVALRIGRPGVELAGTFMAWSDVGWLRCVPGRWGRPAQLRLARVDGVAVSLPLDQIDVRPATLDLTARAYSGGRHGVDLSALDS